MLTFFSSAVKRYFLSGLLVVVPLVVTFLALRFLFESVDGILAPLLIRLFGYDVPGLGVLAILSLVMVAGFVVRSFIGSRLIRLWENLLAKAPIIRMIYGGAKQLIEGVAAPHKAAFKDVALVEYPRTGVYSLGFVVSHSTVESPAGAVATLAVFIPSTPTPLTGMVILFPREEVIILDTPGEDAIKFIVSGGIVAPELFTRRSIRPDASQNEL